MLLGVILLLVLFTFNTKSEKINLETLNNYSEFLNFGDKKINKLRKDSLENDIFKSKIDILGEVFKTNIDSIKASGKLDLIFVIDASSSVGESNFYSELRFVKKLLSDVTVDYNHTRVAIITFSSSNNIIKSIDEISKPRKENNKCLFLNKQLKRVKYTGGGTYTLGAFKKAKEIFQNARNDSKKVLFLITDGYSNGGDPIPLANELKDDLITIFTIGIENGNYKELYEISSSPGEYYSFLLDSFKEFESLARRALHVDLKSGDYIPLGISSPCNSLCTDENCCDEKALCTCGTLTGHYSCVCQPGYYGSGLRNSCLPCPPGTYSDGPNLCLPCPDIHHTSKTPALSIKSCKCKPGFQPTPNNQCEVLKCPKITKPPYSYFVKKRDCGNVLNSACGIRCEVGYTLVGSSIRLCQLNSTWSGEEPSCQIKTCPKLPLVPFGTINCSHADLGVTYNSSEKNLPVDTVCAFKCEKGKTLIGSSQRFCLPLARWDGLKTSCKQIKCSKLPPIPNGEIEPKSCLSGKQSFGKQCNITCNEGFKLEGPSQKTCTGNHGLWDTKAESFCKDIVAPNITCPENITASTLPGKKYGSVTWDHPEVKDNSESEISIWMKPAIKNITGHKFKIGTTQVTYFAQDAFHNRNKCVFFITVKDIEKPTIENCVDPPTFLTSDKTGANVTWDEPNIFDNSQVVKYNKSHEFGYFQMGTTAVNYTAVDPSGNFNNCTIRITIEEAHCEALPDPIYGHSDCSSLEEGMQCVITCQEGYAVPLAQPYVDSSINFICNESESVWYNQEGLMFPECSVTEIPKEIEQSGTIKIKTELDNCSDSKINELENHIKMILQEETCQDNCSISTKATCEDQNESTETEEEKSNKITKRAIDFEEVPHKNTNKRRGRQRINVKFQVKGKFVNHTLSGHNFTVYYHKPKFICPPGFVPRKNRCVQCPKGTFHNVTRNKCQSCPFGYYNDMLGQIVCKTCPMHHSTRKMHSKKIDDCKEHCSPGTFARKKLAKPSKRHPKENIERITLKPHCKSCPIGYYQPDFGQLHCLPCPDNYTTTSVGASSLSHCIQTAREFCRSNICNFGTCIPENDFQFTCDCFDSYFGVYCERKMSGCDSNPCQNKGVCKNIEKGFICECPKGTTGRFCENVEDKCLLNCLNGGTCFQNDLNDHFCICPDGYGGEICQVKISLCDNEICENGGTCVQYKDNFYCQCTGGYIGKRCNILPCDYNPCRHPNQICQNSLENNATKDSYSCICQEGYRGGNCQEEINHCESNPCDNNGTCISTTSNYTCYCSKLFFGERCQFKRTCNYTLHFRNFTTSNYINLRGFEGSVREITACLWMQTKDNDNYGTLISYATRTFDNAFTLTDYTGLVLYINNNYTVTDVLLNDGLWHHLCVFWSSTNGTYKLYVDGEVRKNGLNLANDDSIEGGGNMVIGQEQDILGGRFSQSESFVGKMAYVDVWSKELTIKEIHKHFQECQDTFFGDLYGWPEIKEYVQGNIEIETSSFCSKCEPPKPLYNGLINIVDNIAYYSCYNGFQLSNSDYSNGRRCTKAAKWEGFYEPFCKKIYCGYPGFIRNAYIVGTKYYYQDKVTYNCLEGYNLVGNSTLTCTENGTWYPDRPYCVGLQCVAFKKPNNSNLTIIAEHSYEDFIEEETLFDIGTQIEIECNDNANLKGENLITCQENGTWDFEPPQCVIEADDLKQTNCAIELIPPAPDNGYIVEDSLYAFGNGTDNIIEYKCRTGYKLTGINYTTCIIDGYWTEINMTCEPVLCRQPKYKNMAINKEGDHQIYHFGNLVKFDCVEGYKSLGDISVRCMANSRWTKMRGNCIRKSCRKPSVSEATVVQGASYYFGDQVTLQCPNQMEYVLTCNKYAMWEGHKDESC